MQPSAGTARHDAVAWGYARQADSMGVDIIQNCEVTGFDITGGKINGVRTSRGDIKVKKIGLCVAGSRVAAIGAAGQGKFCFAGAVGKFRLRKDRRSDPVLFDIPAAARRFVAQLPASAVVGLHA